jgi:protocatechuate 3,4-dioxygenase beta subunit
VARRIPDMLKSLLPAAVLLCSCSIDRTMSSLTTDELRRLEDFRKLKKENALHIGSEKEEGEALTLCLTFVEKESKQILSNQRVHFYHADSNGEYQPSVLNDESTARLNGEATTDDQGRIYLKTTLPGDYGSSKDNRHIHTTVFGAKPEAYDIHFKQYTTYMGSRFAKGSDQHFLADLKKDDNDNLVAFLTIEIKNPVH